VSPNIVVHMLDEFVGSTNNGITYQTFTKGEFYSVPDYLASSMYRRNVAEPAKAEHVPPDAEPAELPKLDLKGSKS